MGNRLCRPRAATILVFSIILLALASREARPALAQAQSQPDTGISEGDYRRMDLEIKRRLADLELQKAWISALGSSIPIVAAILALAGTVLAARRTVVAHFTTKAAELSLQGEGPNEVINRAKLLANLYESLLPPDFIDRVGKLEAKHIGRIFAQAPFGAELKKEVIELLAKYPEQRRRILEDYMLMFEYDFLATLPKDPPKDTEPSTKAA